MIASRNCLMREDDRGGYVRVREGILRLNGYGNAWRLWIGRRVVVTVNWYPAEEGRYPEIPAGRCFRPFHDYGNDSYLGAFQWEVKE